MRINYIDMFIDRLKRFPGFFPEFKNYTVIPVFAAMAPVEGEIAYMTNNRIYGMELTGGAMGIVNFEDVSGS